MAGLVQTAKTFHEDFKAGTDPVNLPLDGMTDLDLNRLSMKLEKEGKYAMAEIAARRSVPLAAQRTGPKSQNYAGALSQHAVTLGRLGYNAKAETLYTQALEIDRATIGDEHPDYAIHLSNLAGTLMQLDRRKEAEPMYREALRIMLNVHGPDYPHTQQAQRILDDFFADTP